MIGAGSLQRGAAEVAEKFGGTARLAAAGWNDVIGVNKDCVADFACATRDRALWIVCGLTRRRQAREGGRIGTSDVVVRLPGQAAAQQGVLLEPVPAALLIQE